MQVKGASQKEEDEGQVLSDDYYWPWKRVLQLVRVVEGPKKQSK